MMTRPRLSSKRHETWPAKTFTTRFKPRSRSSTPRSTRSALELADRLRLHHARHPAQGADRPALAKLCPLRVGGVLVGYSGDAQTALSTVSRRGGGPRAAHAIPTTIPGCSSLTVAAATAAACRYGNTLPVRPPWIACASCTTPAAAPNGI